MVLNLCEIFLGPIAARMRAARRLLPDGGRGAASAIDECKGMIESSASQLESVNGAIKRYNRAYLPATMPMAGTEPLAAAVISANKVSYNLEPRVRMFCSPTASGGRVSWEALRQPVDYVALIKGGEGCNFLCDVRCGADVRIVTVRSKQEVAFPPGRRLRWLGRNVEVTLRSGARAYVVMFVRDSDRESGDPAGSIEGRKALIDIGWSEAYLNRYAMSHGEIPRATQVSRW